MSYGNLETLYRQVIMDHYKNPRNKGLKENDEIYYNVHLKNPTCGDDLTIQIKVEDNKITEVNHDGSGCSISMSAASVMSETIVGLTLDEVKNIIDNYVKMVKGEAFDEEMFMGDAIVYQGVSKFPARFKCATIAWKALDKAITNHDECIHHHEDEEK